MSKCDTALTAYEMTLASTFRDHQLMFPCLGNKDTIALMDKKKLEDHKTKTYLAKNFVLVATGGVNH